MKSNSINVSLVQNFVHQEQTFLLKHSQHTNLRSVYKCLVWSLCIFFHSSCTCNKSRIRSCRNLALVSVGTNTFASALEYQTCLLLDNLPELLLCHLLLKPLTFHIHILELIVSKTCLRTFD